jgi:hypothetical protein
MSRMIDEQKSDNSQRNSGKVIRLKNLNRLILGGKAN